MKTRNSIQYIAAALIPIVQGCMDGNYNNRMPPNHLITSREGYRISIGDLRLEAYAEVDAGRGIEVRRGKNFYGAAGNYSQLSRPNMLKKVLKEADGNGDKVISPEEAFKYDLKRSRFKRR